MSQSIVQYMIIYTCQLIVIPPPHTDLHKKSTPKKGRFTVRVLTPDEADQMSAKI
jgi:hypothetical protein